MKIDIRPIRTEDDYEWALREIEQYFDKEPKTGSVEEARFEIMATLISAYEEKHYPIEDPEPIPYLKSIMEMTGRTQTDLAALIGRARASEVLARKRYLSKAQITKLRDTWGIPVDPLLKHYPLVKSKARPKTRKSSRRLAA